MGSIQLMSWGMNEEHLQLMSAIGQAWTLFPVPPNMEWRYVIYNIIEPHLFVDCFGCVPSFHHSYQEPLRYIPEDYTRAVARNLEGGGGHPCMDGYPSWP